MDRQDVKFSIRKKILGVTLVAALPFLAISIYLLISMSNSIIHIIRLYRILLLQIIIIWILKKRWMKVFIKWLLDMLQ